MRLWDRTVLDHDAQPHNMIEHEHRINLERGERYYIKINDHFIRFNATVIYLSGTFIKTSSEISIRDGDEVLYSGTVKNLKLTGDTTSSDIPPPNTPLFKPGQRIRDSYCLQETDLLKLDSTISLSKNNG